MSEPKKKKLKLADVVADCIIAGVVIVLVVVLCTAVGGKKKADGSGTDSTDAAKTTEAPQTVTGEEGELRYACVIAEGSSNDTVFYVTLHPDRKTYEESLQAASTTSELDKGSYEEKDGKFITTSSKDKKQLTYAKDGDYLIVESEMYEGTIAEDDTFDAVCTYEVEGECKKTITFKKDGTYEQELISYAQEGSSEEDSKQTTTGTYQRDGKFIKRTSDSSETLLDLYVYDNRLSDAYYKLEK